MKQIHVELTEESIDRALRELVKFQKWIEDGTQRLLELIGERGKVYADTEYLSALTIGDEIPEVTYSVSGNTVTVTASGADVLFIEFGTGVTYPESHPDPLAGQYPHGEYGYGLGKLKSGWRFPETPGADADGLAWPDPKHEGYMKTYGNPANASLYNARTQIEDTFLELAKEAFGTYA